MDGTLIRSVGADANALHKLAFAEGMRQVFGVDTNIDDIKHHGSTDPLILVSVLAHHGVPHDQVGRIVWRHCFCRFTTAGQTPNPKCLAGHLPLARQRSPSMVARVTVHEQLV